MNTWSIFVQWASLAMKLIGNGAVGHNNKRRVEPRLPLAVQEILDLLNWAPFRKETGVQKLRKKQTKRLMKQFAGLTSIQAAWLVATFRDEVPKDELAGYLTQHAEVRIIRHDQSQYFIRVIATDVYLDRLPEWDEAVELSDALGLRLVYE